MRKVLALCLVFVLTGIIFYSQWATSGEEKPSLPLGPLKVEQTKPQAEEIKDSFYEEVQLFTDALTLIR